MDKKKIQNQQTFTHFVSIPLIQPQIKEVIFNLQQQMLNDMSELQKQAVVPADKNLFHITICMLSLQNNQKEKAVQSIKSLQEQISKTLIKLNLQNIDCFQYKQQVNLFYLDIQNDENFSILQEITHIIIKQLLLDEVIYSEDLKQMHISFKNGKFYPEKMHITLFRTNRTKEVVQWQNIQEKYKQKYVANVQLNYVDISTRFQYDQEKYYLPLVRMQLLQ